MLHAKIRTHTLWVQFPVCALFAAAGRVHILKVCTTICPPGVRRAAHRHNGAGSVLARTRLCANAPDCLFASARVCAKKCQVEYFVNGDGQHQCDSSTFQMRNISWIVYDNINIYRAWLIRAVAINMMISWYNALFNKDNSSIMLYVLCCLHFMRPISRVFRVCWLWSHFISFLLTWHNSPVSSFVAGEKRFLFNAIMNPSRADSSYASLKPEMHTLCCGIKGVWDVCPFQTDTAEWVTIFTHQVLDCGMRTMHNISQETKATKPAHSRPLKLSINALCSVPTVFDASVSKLFRFRSCTLNW